MEALAELWTSLGFSCESGIGSFPGSGGGFHIHCERADEVGHANYVAGAVYWTPQSVQTISLSIVSMSEEPIDGASAAAQVFPATADLAGGPRARTWVAQRIGDPTCADDCVEVVDGLQLAISVGSRGGHLLHIVAL